MDNSYDLWIMDGRPLDARVMVCSVIEEPQTNGKNVTVLGFTAFYLDSYVSSSNISVAFVAMSPDLLATMSTPEPSSLLALFCGLSGAGIAWRRKR